MNGDPNNYAYPIGLFNLIPVFLNYYHGIINPDPIRQRANIESSLPVIFNI